MLNLKLHDPNADSYEKIIRSAEAYHISLESYGTESFVTSLCNVTDLFIRIGKVFATNLTRFNRSVKRGEMEKYVDDHTLLVKSIESSNYFDIKDINVSTPTGMSKPYPNAVNLIADIFSNLDAVTIADITCKSLENMRTKVLRDEDIAADARMLKSSVSVKNKFLDQSAEAMKAMFKNGMHPYTFGQMFKNMNELIDTKNKIIACEAFLSQCKTLDEKTQRIVGIAKDSIEMKQHRQISKAVASDMADAGSTLAKVLNVYGMAALNLMSLAHNMTLVYNAVYEKVK